MKRCTVMAAALFVLAGCTGPAPESRPTTTGQRATSPSPTLTPSPTPAVYQAAIQPIPPAVAAEMVGVSWRPGCPVPIDQLRVITLVYYGFDGTIHSGELVAHTDLAPAVVRIFGKLFDARFPIRRMQRVDAYGGDDNASMAADNTSMFNCRYVEGSTRWSWHAFGKAIDINTVENPYVRGGTIQPPAGSAYLDRANVRPGMIIAGDVVTRAFAAEGFRWGGDFRSLKDYQHFEVLD